MPSIIIAPVCILFVVGSCQNGFCGEPIREKLDKAISEYKTVMSALEQKVNEELTKDEDRIRLEKKGVDRRRLEFVLAQRDAFNDSGEVPRTLKNKRIPGKIEEAKIELKKAFAKAEDEYLRNKQDEQIAKLELELKVLQKSIPPIEPNATLLFDGRTLDGWEPQNGVLSYRVDRGHLFCFQNVNGRLQTKKVFSNFSLKLEYQFPRGEPLANPHGTGIVLIGTGSGNYVSGVDGKGGIEYQLNPDKSGRLNVLYGKGDVNPGLPRKDVKERQVGLWNQVEIRFEGNELTFFLNGEQVNHATLAQPVDCFIALRNGSMVRFRYVRIISPPPEKA